MPPPPPPWPPRSPLMLDVVPFDALVPASLLLSPFRKRLPRPML